MPGLFEQFPHTNLHELNLDWMIDLLNTFKDELENRAVLSVNGMTGEVTLYESENVVLPPLTNVSSWRLVRMMDGQYVGVLFQDGHVWFQQGNQTLKLLTNEDIPTSAGVVSWNGRTGVVNVTGADIPIDNSADPDSIRLAFETEHTERVNADEAILTSINTKLSKAEAVNHYLNLSNNNPDNTSINIPANSDLNDYGTPGTYISLDSATTSSLQNIPDGLAGHFKLFVNVTTGTPNSSWWGNQIISHTDRIWIRGHQGTVFEEWLELAHEINEDIYSNITWTIAPTEQYSQFIEHGTGFDLVYYSTTAHNYSNGQVLGNIPTNAYTPNKGFYVPAFNDDTQKAVNGSVYLSPTGSITYYGETLTNIKLVFHASWTK